MEVFVKWLYQQTTYAETFPDVKKIVYDFQRGIVPNVEIHCSLFNKPVSLLLHNILEITATDATGTTYDFCKDGTNG